MEQGLFRFLTHCLICIKACCLVFSSPWDEGQGLFHSQGIPDLGTHLSLSTFSTPSPRFSCPNTEETLEVVPVRMA